MHHSLGHLFQSTAQTAGGAKHGIHVSNGELALCPCLQQLSFVGLVGIFRVGQGKLNVLFAFWASICTNL
jgi:hypothetical protein